MPDNVDLSYKLCCYCQSSPVKPHCIVIGDAVDAMGNVAACCGWREGTGMKVCGTETTIIS
jgi:hypothetical protein